MIDLDSLDELSLKPAPHETSSWTEMSQQTISSDAIINPSAKSYISLNNDDQNNNLLTTMLITANVGTIFEEVSD